jgi:PAS domain S-box-containing protein
MTPGSGADAIFVVGRLGRIEDVDEGACTLLGYSRDELLALHGAELILPEDRPAVATTLDRMRRGAIEWRAGRIVRKDGSVIPVEVSARPLADEHVELSIRTRPGP